MQTEIKSLGGSTIQVTQETINNISNYYTEVNEGTGFVDPDSVEFSFNDTNRTFTITPTGDSFVFYAFGTRYEKEEAESVQITDTEGLWYISYNVSGVLCASQDIWDLGTQVPVATITWSSGTGTVDEEPPSKVKDSKFENIYAIGCSASNITAGQVILIHPIVASETIELLKRLPYSRIICTVAPTAQATFDIQVSQNGGAFASKGSAIIGAGEYSGTFTWNNKVTLDGSDNDMIMIIAPAVADSTLANVGISIKGIRV